MKKLTPYRVALLVLLIIIIALNSVRLFLYGFIISFMIVILDRAFFNKRKKSDYQFYNLFVVITFALSLFYTFSPVFRYWEFKISHPKWKDLEIVSVQAQPFHVKQIDQQISSITSPIVVTYKDSKQTQKTVQDSLSHYSLYIPFSLGYEQTLKDELLFIHNRSLDNMVKKKEIHLFENPRNHTIKTFYGSDVFALRHSRWFHFALYLLFGLFVFTFLNLVFRFKTIMGNLKDANEYKRFGGIIYISLFLLTLVLNVLLVIHYLRF